MEATPSVEKQARNESNTEIRTTKACSKDKQS